VVIGIIGVLTTIVLSSLDQSKAKSRDNRRVQDIATITLALENYYNDHRSYPQNFGSNRFIPDYLPVELVDPSTKGDYLYVGIDPISDGCRAYHIGATLELTSSRLNPDSNANFNSKTTTSTRCPNGYPPEGFDGSGMVYDMISKY
ncbi:MAG: type II secretion system protein, partial [Candidatus Paceibacterota bacterium]